MDAEAALFKRRWENSQRIRDGMHEVMKKQMTEIAELRALLADCLPLFEHVACGEVEERVRAALCTQQGAKP